MKEGGNRNHVEEKQEEDLQGNQHMYCDDNGDRYSEQDSLVSICHSRSDRDMSDSSSLLAVADGSEGGKVSTPVLNTSLNDGDDEVNNTNSDVDNYYRSNDSNFKKIVSSTKTRNKNKTKKRQETESTTVELLSPSNRTDGLNVKCKSESTTYHKKGNETSNNRDIPQGTKRPPSLTRISLPSLMNRTSETDSSARKNLLTKAKETKTNTNTTITSDKRKAETKPSESIPNPAKPQDETREPRGTSLIFSRLFSKSNKQTKNEWWLRSAGRDDEARQEHESREHEESMVGLDGERIGIMVMVFYDRISRRKKRNNETTVTTDCQELRTEIQRLDLE
mmetsp:Transcript_33609/g.79252  ORF Transcript_33609/g.79252 Transcript_33609/m.79252 type:complete len:336 (+) Transcript_33609:179-1186(+)|eukprot:CAMPEP_0172393100 /NCGR_PEP_ID=MMETSP1061-20121228/9059_1 /TAXON_ID=37318 /ORGANISM="Pseudo-nitzschia pungens, Strain cf. pungens" /LENGTH=335 /DNA_ID=CAMNT_0013124085 /DNA_START=100 /DNA_END=1107 /DNA_ORIENTATION=+